MPPSPPFPAPSSRLCNWRRFTGLFASRPVLHFRAGCASLRSLPVAAEIRMTTRPPAEIGMTLDDIDTPALLVDLDAFERNLRRLAERVAGSGVRLRPHAKTHKCPVIALKQIEFGAVG